MTRIGLWPLDRSRYPFVLRGHSSVVEHLEFAPDGSFLVSSSPDGTVRLWPRRQGPGEEGRVLFDWGHSMQQFVGWMDLSPDGRFIIATGGESSAVLIPLDGSPVIRLGGFDQRVLRTAIGPDSRLVATPGRVDGRLVVRLWDLVGGGFSDLPAEEVHGSGLLAHGTVVAFTPEGDLLAGDGGRLVRWDLATGQASIVTEGVGLFRLASSGSAAISHNAVDRQFDQPVSIHDLVTGAGRELTSHGRDLLGLALDPTGSIAVTGGGDGIVRVGRATGEMPHHLVGHRGSVLAVAVSPDGQWIASGGTDGTIRLWPMPDLEQRSLHDLSHREFLAHLDQQTNLRVVVDEEHPEGRVKAMDVPIVWE